MAKKRKPKRRHNSLQTIIVACLLLCLCCFGIISYLESIQIPWNLTLVNQWNPLPEDYTVELTELANGQKVDIRIYPDLQQMFDDARAQGVHPFVREGYRTAQQQQAILDERIQEYLNAGYSQEEAIEAARDWVALPGTSEHELGLAVDINADVTLSSSEEVYDWLAKHAHEYGFILRYPEGKEELTGISYEPWHFRYVGLEDAQKIYTQGICLEEYIQQKEEKIPALFRAGLS